MKIITSISDPANPGFYKLKTSCAIKELDLVVLTRSQASWTNHRVKDNVLGKYLENEDDDAIVLFTDGYDSILLADEEEIIEKYKQSGAEILFSAETCCYPDTSLEAEYPAVNDSPYRYLNSGGFIGKAGTLRRLHEKPLTGPKEKFAFSNQYLWTMRFLLNQDLVQLDTSCHIFCTFSPEIVHNSLPEESKGDWELYVKRFYEFFDDHFTIANGRIYNRITGSWPCIAHFNGGSSCFLDRSAHVWEMIYDLIPGSKKSRFIEMA